MIFLSPALLVVGRGFLIKKGRETMLSLISSLKSRFVEDESGQGMVEYVLIIALIAVAVIAFLPGVATAINNVLTNITSKLSGA
jgi:pilus assembly protein Flp/PilA